VIRGELWRLKRWAKKKSQGSTFAKNRDAFPQYKKTKNVGAIHELLLFFISLKWNTMEAEVFKTLTPRHSPKKQRGEGEFHVT
jgi:hypothetical protein